MGNGDAHSKNYSLAISETATFSMTPLYDVAPLYLLNEVFQHFGQHLDGQGRLRHLTAEHLHREAATWAVADTSVPEVMASVAIRVRAALPACHADHIDVDRVAQVVDARATAMLDFVAS